MIGIEWINKYHGRAGRLYKCDNDAQGFAETLNGIVDFDAGNDMAWDKDFEEYGVGRPPDGFDHAFVDNVEIAYFAGHGNSRGFMFGVDDKDDGWARWTDMNLGDHGLKWLVASACETMQDCSEWKDQVFKGLHIIMGFKTICSDSGSRGRRFAERLNDGYTILDAWTRACRETEYRSKRFACLWANNESSDTMNDHWIGEGEVSADPLAPTNFTYLEGRC